MNSVFVGLSALGNVMTVTFGHSRVCQEIAKEGILPFTNFWASTWPMGAPSGGILLHFLPSIIMITAIPFGDAYNFIVNVEGYSRAIVYFMVVIGLLNLRQREAAAERPFRVWLSIAVFGLIGQTFLLIAPFLRPPGGKGDTSQPYWSYPFVGISVMLAGCLYYVVFVQILPKAGRYKMDFDKITLPDGTRVMKLSRVMEE